MVIAVLAAAPRTQAQDLVQAAVDGLADPLVAHEAGLLLQQQEGVIMARFDVHTRNMMLHVTPACSIDAGMINGWLAGLEMRIRCFSRRDAREGPFKHVDADRCGGQPAPER